MTKDNKQQRMQIEQLERQLNHATNNSNLGKEITSLKHEIELLDDTLVKEKRKRKEAVEKLEQMQSSFDQVARQRVQLQQENDDLRLKVESLVKAADLDRGKIAD